MLMEIEQYLYWQTVINSGELIFTLLAILCVIFFVVICILAYNYIELGKQFDVKACYTAIILLTIFFTMCLMIVMVLPGNITTTLDNGQLLPEIKGFIDIWIK